MTALRRETLARRVWAVLALAVLADAARASAQAEPAEGAIENIPLDELLDLGLADTLGETQAVSRSTEDVLSAPATITTLDAAAIRLSGARTIADLLRFVPGVQVVQLAPGSYLVAVRGMSGLTGNNVVVTVDGVPINNPLDGSIDWGLLPIAVRDVERIEVVRGPVSTIYGANAYTGVINIVSYRGFGHEPQGAVRLEAGSDTELSPTSALALRIQRQGRRIQHALFGEAQVDGAHREAELGSEHPRLWRGSMLGRLGFTLDAGQLDLELAAAYGSRPALEHLVLEHEAERRLVSFVSGQFSSRDLPGRLGKLTLWGRSALSRTDAPEGNFTRFSYAGTRSSRTSFGLDLELALHRTFMATLGGEYNLDRVSAPYLTPEERGDLRSGVGFYARTAWDPTAHWSFTAALRGDVPTVTARTELSYRLSAVFHDTNYAVRLAAASAYRALTYVEAGGSFVDENTGVRLLEGAPGIENPRNDSIELGALYSPRVDLSLSATAYGSRVTHLTIEEFEPLARRSFAADDHPTYLIGGELEAKWVLSDSFVWSGFAAVVRHFAKRDAEVPTVAVEGMSSTLMAGSELRGALLRDRLRYGLGAVLATGRSYALASGVPPVVATREVDPGILLTAMVERELGTSWPLWLFGRVQAQLPRQVEAPVPGSSRIGSAGVLGLEKRWGD